jgi:hypothetical protein
MVATSRDGYSQGCVIAHPTSSNEAGPQLANYLVESSQRLSAITELVGRGEAVDWYSHAWMLAQVDYIVDVIGNESLELSDEMRSDLLQFLLAVANLNEHIRRHASPRL